MRRSPRSANYAQGEMQGTAALYEPGDLVPVDVIGIRLGQRPGDPEPPELGHSPIVHEAFLDIDNFRGSASSFPPASGHGRTVPPDGPAAHAALTPERGARPGELPSYEAGDLDACGRDAGPDVRPVAILRIGRCRLTRPGARLFA
jgi:hypothetical protein